MALNIGENVNIDGNPVATDSDVEELEQKLKKARRSAWIWRGITGLVTVISLVTRFVV